MKLLQHTILVLLILITSLGCDNQSKEENNASQANKIEYDEDLASELGADEFGMRKYIMAFLKAGPNQDHDEKTAQKLQKGHMENISRLASEGKLILAGPFLDEGELRGIFIFDVETIQEARKLTETDPAVQAGLFEMEFHPWYGAAGLLKVNDIQERISKTSP